MNLLITGGAGFIGSHFIKFQLKNYPDTHITNVDSLTYAAHPDMPEELSALSPKRYRFYKMDIAQPEIEDIIRENKIDAIVNFAAESHVDRSILDPSSFVRTNVMGVQNLLTIARKNSGVRFVQISTDEVYGSLGPQDPQFTERSPLEPNSPYAASKASADLMIYASFKTHRQNVVTTRCTNNYGPSQFPEKLIPLLIANAIEDKSIPVYGDGLQVRDWIYVEDHCRGIDAVLREGRVGEIYNISSQAEKPNIEIVKRILSILKKPESLIKYVGDRPGHDRRYGLAANKISNELGWKPQTSFESGIMKTVEWYLGHQNWWKKVREKDYQRYYKQNYENKFTETAKGV